ncbi:thioesterase II family protein [Ruminococcus champanellensis]|uniref:thioesterase II family protein n=1 Tax=Ruminococcus champanellensis TaxID=1161942 RepID=UPI002E797D6B|nr:thioesterase domain-containing protein [Ruminococcus champanellensis]MED9890804.1 thioesterase domain-containing protein [Ruminococcus champanellensis]
MTSSQGKWFPTVLEHPDSSCRIFCFPHAGAGPTAYLEWLRYIPEGTDFFPVTYPMREQRRRESMPDSLQLLGQQIAAENAALFREKPCILLGHCAGAAIAYETAAALEAQGIIPNLLTVSAANAPCVPLTLSVDPQMELPQAAQVFKQFGFIAEPFASNEAYVRCFVPVLLQDFILFQNYCGRKGQKLHCPILEIHGEEDPMIQPERLKEWELYTDQLTHMTVPGAHFYFSPETLPRLMQAMLEKGQNQ